MGFVPISRRRALQAVLAAALPGVPQPMLANTGLDAPIGRIRWQPDTGVALTQVGFIGKPLALTISYSACRRTCSTTLLVLREMQVVLDKKIEK